MEKVSDIEGSRGFSFAGNTYMFDGHAFGADYEPPEGWEIVETVVRNFGVSIILRKKEERNGRHFKNHKVDG